MTVQRCAECGRTWEPGAEPGFRSDECPWCEAQYGLDEYDGEA